MFHRTPICARFRKKLAFFLQIPPPTTLAVATLRVSFAPGTVERLPEKKRLALEGVLANDPRPRYQNDPERVYGIDFAGFEIKFTVRDEELFVLSISDSVE